MLSILSWTPIALRRWSPIAACLLAAATAPLGANGADAEAAAPAAAAEPAAAEADAGTSPEPVGGEASPSEATAAAQPKKPAKVRFAEFVLESALPESPGQTGPFGDLQTDLRKTVSRFKKAADDDSIQGIVLNLRNPSLGRGKIDELRQAIQQFRKSGKKVHAQLEIATTADYLLATACDEIIMPESGFLLLPGVRLEPTFYKGLMSKMGVKADFLHMGDAKGAGETYTRKKWSKPVRENLDAMAGDLFEQMIETIVRSRPVTDAQAREAVDLALLTAAQAKEAGLIDRVAYADEVRAGLAGQHGGSKLVYVQNYGRKNVDTDFSGPTGFFKLMQVLTGGGSTSGRRAGKKIAVVYAVGPIMTGESQEELFGGSTVGSTTIVEALAEAAADDKTAAIVLRVDSPGGSAVASDLMWRKIQEIEKPVIASMGDIAASGGYYISMGCDKIIAEPGTITGSIGVVSGKFAIKGMYDKLGLTTDLITRGQNSGIFSGMRKWNASERAAMMRMMEDTYTQFTGKAAAGRGMPVEQLKALAGGKVYTGRQAKANGLVDELGTLNDAIAAAKEMAGLDAEEKVRIETFPEPTEFFETLFGGAKGEKEVRVSLDGVGLPAELVEAARRWQAWQRVLQREPVGLFLPFELRVE
ncbi:MAG: signal peptide peptidase SppA [Planctomycetota bacterium]